MTISTSTGSVQYNGDGVSTVLAVPYYFLQNTDLLVTQTNTNVSPATVTTLVYGTGYTVAGAGVEAGGSITLAVAAVAGVYTTITRGNMQATQLVHYVPNDEFPASTHEAALDKLTMLIQQAIVASGLAIQLPPNAALAGVSNLLPYPVGGNLLGWNAGGTELVNTGPSGLGAGNIYDVNVSASAAIQSTKLQDTSPLASAIARSINSVLADQISLKSWGSIGNGVHDDTAFIQLALNVVGAAGGGTIFVPDGSYLVSSRLFFNYSNVYLVGRSRYTNTFKAANSASGIGIHGMFEFAAGVNNCGIIDIGMDGNSANNATQGFGAIYTNGNNSGIIIQNCYLRNFIFTTVEMNASGSSTPNANFRIFGNRIENCGWDGIGVYFGYFGDISDNIIVSTGGNGIRTDGVLGSLGTAYSQQITINGNRVTKAIPPTVLSPAAGGSETGFMIVVGAADQDITIADNVCYDNRNAKSDGIGLGQDGVHVNAGIVVTGNTVQFAGLFGIDATQNSLIVGNVIQYSAQCGIKVGTDLGGTANNMIVSDNVIYNANNGSSPGIEGIWVQSAVTGSTYNNVRITNNVVVDDRTGAAQNTTTGLLIDFTNITFSNCDFSGNDFRQVKTIGVNTTGTIPTNSGWTWSNNRLKGSVENDFNQITTATPPVFGFENFQIVNGSATTVTNFTYGFDGMRFRIQHNDGNTTYQFASNPNMVGNGGANITVAANGVWDFWRFSGVWYGQKVN